MSLAALLGEIERSQGPVTGIELATRLGIAPGRVAMMLDALRAAGRLGPEAKQQVDTCASAGACSMTCPGPEECSLAIGLTVTSLEIRSASAR